MKSSEERVRALGENVLGGVFDVDTEVGPQLRQEEGCRQCWELGMKIAKAWALLSTAAGGGSLCCSLMS